ncbi:MAG: FAD-dependent oxidoreductase [Deltaproteobacteria bacterium]|nr:FAD-dependent oxidoreductase [Deltaproteobacteria bacterium]
MNQLPAASPSRITPLLHATQGAVLVVGAGIAGMQASLDLAAAGFRVHLLEKNVSIGGVMAQLDKTFPTNDCSTCMISPKLIEVAGEPNIEILSRAELLDLTGEPGDFTARVKVQPRYVDLARCSGCGECTKVCPVDTPADFNQGLNSRKAIFRHFPQAAPGAYAIDKLGASPCRDACPVGVAAQGYLALAARGRYAEALALIRRDNPLPAVCGRVCTHPCEEACARGAQDQPLAIREVKRFLADWEVAQGHMDLPTCGPARPEKVAVAGSGPAGLACAYFLALEGVGVTIFEALPAPGGMLRVGIPAYRLPREVLDYEIEFIRRLGVDIRCNTPLDREKGPRELLDQGYGAVFLALGAHRGLATGVAGEELAGVRLGVDYLRLAALGQAPELGPRVAVIGGGNVALDAARTALRHGAAQVTVLYRRTEALMPAYSEEVAEAREEGVRFEFLTAPAEYLGRDGRLVAVELMALTMGPPDESGRQRPIPRPDQTRRMPLDAVILAVGQAPDLEFLAAADAALAGRGGLRLAADPLTLATASPGVFAGGDALTGPATVVEAIAQGRRAAESILRHLAGRDLREGREDRPPVAPAPQGHVTPLPRQAPPQAPAGERKQDFREVVGALTEEQVRAEAARCLSCGICSECRQCETVCQAGAIDHSQRPREMALKVGAVIMAPGFTTFDAADKPEFGYGRFPNVITSLEMERLNSASGPTAGHLQRPGDGKEPQRVAWLQCVGSRDLSVGRDYCSYVCCMYAAKQAVIAREHLPGLEATIFHLDLRAQGKGFDRYCTRAREQGGARWVRAFISRVLEDKATGDLILEYRDEADQPRSERFDLVVLSVGLTPAASGVETARRSGVATDRFGFAARQALNPLLTSRPGVFACGVFQAPRDIPDTVMQASGAAAEAGELLAAARGSQVTETAYPPEREVLGETPRVGVFVCHCGVNIAGVVDVPQVAAYAGGLPGVVLAQDFLFTCSSDSQERIAAMIREHRLNRVVVASCSPRTHEPLFRDTLRRAGLNPYLFEMANIRDQCSWVHQEDPVRATAKAQDLVRMSAARAALLEPLTQLARPVKQAAVVIGGGPAGLTAALSLAEQGFYTHLVEKTDRLGGLANRLGPTLEGFDPVPWLADLEDQVRHHGAVGLHLRATVAGVSGHVGDFAVRVRGEDGEKVLEAGAVIVATGAREHQPQDHGHGSDSRVLTQLALGEALQREEPWLTEAQGVVMLQCVGSRNEEHSYCSRVCCTTAVTHALALKELNPACQVTILYRDMRTFALKELGYLEARRRGVQFVRFSPERPPQVAAGEDSLLVTVYDPLLGADLALAADRLILAAAIRPGEDTARLASTLKLPLDQDGFFMEAHMKLRPVDFASPGHFLAGAAHGPKFLEEVISQAKAAAARAATVLARRERLVGGEVAMVDAERCVACLTCVRTCPFGVPRLNREGVVEIDPAACQGCGSCAAACPRKLIQLAHHTDAQVLAKATAFRPAAGLDGRTL